ncbi:MAG: VOC family protein [Thermoproteota archaeon]
MPAKTVIDHMHLHVSNLAKAPVFYSETWGLDLTCTFPGAYFFAADKYHHHIATNTWLGRDLAPASPEKPGLNHFGIELPVSELDGTMAHLTSHTVAIEKESMDLRDPDGITIRLYFRN